MRANHAPLSLLGIFRGVSFRKRTVPSIEHMPLSRTSCSIFLFAGHHDLGRDASILDEGNPLVSHKLRFLYYN